MTKDEELLGADLMSGDVASKCADAKTEARRMRVKMRKAILPRSLQVLGKFIVDKTTPVIGLWVHDNPFIVLSTDKMVYVDGSDDEEGKKEEEEVEGGGEE